MALRFGAGGDGRAQGKDLVVAASSGNRVDFSNFAFGSIVVDEVVAARFGHQPGKNGACSSRRGVFAAREGMAAIALHALPAPQGQRLPSYNSIHY